MTGDFSLRGLFWLSRRALAEAFVARGDRHGVLFLVGDAGVRHELTDLAARSDLAWLCAGTPLEALWLLDRCAVRAVVVSCGAQDRELACAIAATHPAVVTVLASLGSAPNNIEAVLSQVADGVVQRPPPSGQPALACGSA